MAFTNVWSEKIQHLVWLEIISSSLAFYVIIALIRRLYFHPLSHYPGPFFAKVSSAYAAYHSYRGNMHLDVHRCHEKYGSIIRYGPNRLLTVSAQGMHDIYAYGKPFRKSQGYATMVPWKGGWSTATSIDKTMHRRLRKSVSSGFSTNCLKEFEPAVLRNLEIYFEKLLEGSQQLDGWTEPKDMNKWNKWLALDTMAEFGFGTRIGLLDNPETRYILELLHMHTWKLGVYDEWPALNKIGIAGVVSWLLRLMSPTAQRFNAWHKDFTDNIISNNSDDKRGIFAPIIRGPETSDAGPRHTTEQMIAEGSFLTFTSADANSTALSGLHFYLSHHPKVHETLSNEIREKFPKDGLICWGPELAGCVYLRACLDETLRMLPPASGVHWRESERDDAFIDGEIIPAGCDVGTSLYALFRSHDAFRDPLRFWPERWMEGVLPEDELARARQAFRPFSLGPRACAGLNVAVMVISVSMANLVNSFDFRLAEKSLDHIGKGTLDARKRKSMASELQFENHFTFSSWKEGPYLQFRRQLD